MSGPMTRSHKIQVNPVHSEHVSCLSSEFKFQLAHERSSVVSKERKAQAKRPTFRPEFSPSHPFVTLTFPRDFLTPCATFSRHQVLDTKS